MSEQKQPVRVGEKLRLAVERIGKNGDPVMFYEGLIIFLKDNSRKGFPLGMQIEVKITKVKEKFAFAELVHG